MALLFLDSTVLSDLLRSVSVTTASGVKHFDVVDLVFAIVTLFAIHKFARSLASWFGQWT
jgi:hypothetical protein